MSELPWKLLTFVLAELRQKHGLEKSGCFLDAFLLIGCPHKRVALSDKVVFPLSWELISVEKL